ncbi:MAG: AAA ATPase, partial [uncultured bacterium]
PPKVDDWPSIQTFLQKHFIWPVDGRLTATQVSRCLGLMDNPPLPISLYHDDVCVPPDLYKQIWSWCTSHVKNIRSLDPPPATGLIDTYLFMQRQEWEKRTFAILAFQKNPLSTRVEQFRAIGPLAFLGIVSEGREIRYFFSIDPKAPIAKFRVGDFLKLSIANSTQIQDGFSVILTSYSPEEGTLSVQSLSDRMPLSKNHLYAIDECATDWNAPKIETVLHRLKNSKFRPELTHMLHGHGKNSPIIAAEWVEQWYLCHAERAGLNSMQKQALLFPFLKNISLIEGPPGTGKTHLLVWTLIALIAHAKSIHRPIKILVTALTHQAIDQILFKVARALDQKEKIPIWKYGRFAEAKSGVEPLQDGKPLMQNTSFILGATGFAVYQLLEDKQFPRVFDWVIFDEASQVLPSYALLSLVFGKGNALFYGDTQQLAPIVTADIPARSILEELISRFGPQHRLRLNETYRMNDLICQFVSRHWYDQELQSSAADQRLELSSYPLFADSIDAYLDPAKPLVVVPVEHEGNLQSSKEEALWIAQAVKRLTLDYSFPIDEIGIISPHRLQNNTILNALKEILPFSIRHPKIDTVERMQGQEFDLVLFSATVSDRENLHSAFLKDYRRFNVSISRARKKFLFVASPLFFKSFPRNEMELIAHFPFEDFFIRAAANCIYDRR